MYHQPQQLDSPPPPSQFRRPWSPMELESHSRSIAQGLRREPSDTDASLEVLDLADYRRMLPHHVNNEYNGYAIQENTSHPEYPSTPPRSFSLESRASMPSPPSLVSASTRSSVSHTQSPRLYTPPPSHRPFSLPSPRVPHAPPESTAGRSHNYPWLVESQDVHESVEGVDISAFPEWSRNWYTNKKPTNTALDPYTPISTFDPALLASAYDNYDDSQRIYPYSSTNESHRDLLPWSLNDEGTGRRITPEMKEERMQMLEREFGRNGMKQDAWYRGAKIIGSVDAKGNIITAGPKRRVIVRWAQGTFALGAAIASLYSALILKPVGTPPPRGTVPAYLLYILSVLTVILLVYMFVVRPCCCSGKRNRTERQEGPPGMMVLPVQHMAGPPNKKKKGKRGNKDNGPSGVSVNLIVDPTMLGSFVRHDKEKTDDDETEITSQRAGGRRRGLFEGLAMEEQWKAARKQLKRLLFFDIALVLLWGAELVVILIGKRCPVGKFDGWCDGYNVATALAAFLSVSFGLSVFFEVKDLHHSKASPRTRT